MLGKSNDFIVPAVLLQKIVKYFVVAGKTTTGGDHDETAGVLIPLDAFNPAVAATTYHNFNFNKWNPCKGEVSAEVLAVIQQVKRERLKEFEEVSAPTTAVRKRMMKFEREPTKKRKAAR